MNRVLQEHKEGTSILILGQGGFPKEVTSKPWSLIIWDLSSTNLFIVADSPHRSITDNVFLLCTRYRSVCFICLILFNSH